MFMAMYFYECGKTFSFVSLTEANKLCDFKPIKGKIIKTVDSVYQGVDTDEECRKKCVESDYRCFSYDLGDPSNKVRFETRLISI